MSRPRTVTIVCANAETRRDLESYLERAGLNARGTASMDTSGFEHPNPSVVVFFPDEFPEGALLREMERLQRESPHVLRLVVTKTPTQLASDERTLVIPKPAWGWTILDAMRSND